MQTVTSFKDAKVPEPHDFKGTILKANPAYFIECTCGYNGLSRDAKECPLCVGRAQHHAKEVATSLQSAAPDKGQVDLKAMVTNAVNEATKEMQDLVAQLKQQLAAASKPADGGNN